MEERILGYAVSPEYDRLRSRIVRIALLLCVPVVMLTTVFTGRAQTAFIDDAWWTYQQDCTGNGCWAGTLAGNMARLNWSPDVTNCNGSLTVYEIVYDRTCGSSSWTPIYTNAPHAISACRSINEQYADVALGSNCACRDYKIELYRDGVPKPDYVRSSTNDVDLASHHEKLLSADICQNDFFSGCVALLGASGSQTDNNRYATKEPGEPDHAGNLGGHSLWYCWTAQTNTPVTFDTVGSTFDTLLAVYTGNDVSNLTLVASNDDIAGATNRLSSVRFTPTAGVTYHIVVDGFGGASGGVVLNWNQTGAALPDLIVWGDAVAPVIYTRSFASNDCEVVEGCATAGTHTLLSFNMETRNIGTGDLELGDPSTNSLFIWASCHGHYHFEHFAEYNLLDTNGNIVATGHKVGFCLVDAINWSPTANPTPKFTGDCLQGGNEGIQSGWADVYYGYDGYNGSNPALPCQYIDISSVPPGTYVLQLTVNPDNLITEANYANNTTLVPITIPPNTCVTPPVNDDFTNAVAVVRTPFSYTEFNNCATGELDDPQVADGGGHSVWFRWTPASNQTAVVTTKRSDFDTVLGVYTGDSLANLTVVATNDDLIQGQYKQSEVSFSATAGTTYYIMVDGYGPFVGTVVFNINPAGNDDINNAYLLTGTSGTTNGYTIAASKEPYEPAHAGDVGGHSIWYNWTAPMNGWVDFNTMGSTFDTTLAVYTGGVTNADGSVTNFTAIAANNDDAEIEGGLTSRVDFYATAGTTYQIAIDGFGGDSGYTTLSWNMEVQLSIAGLPNGAMQLVLTGVDWQRYTLLQSGNFTTWTTNTPAITMSLGSHTYTNSTSAGTNFFKALNTP